MESIGQACDVDDGVCRIDFWNMLISIILKYTLDISHSIFMIDYEIFIALASSPLLFRCTQFVLFLLFELFVCVDCYFLIISVNITLYLNVVFPLLYHSRSCVFLHLFCALPFTFQFPINVDSFCSLVASYVKYISKCRFTPSLDLLC